MRENFQDQQWKYVYLEKWIDCDFKATIEMKRKVFPDSLYKYESFCDYKIQTLEERKLFLCQSSKFDDPYDTKGTFFSKESIEEILATYRKHFGAFSEIEVSNFLKKIPKIMFEKMYITSFSEDKYNFPLWYYYANEHQGYCVEYNFEKLGESNLFWQRLEPVTYLNERINISSMIKRLLRPEQIEQENLYEIDPLVHPLQILGSTIKHKSWAFENEWRYLEQNFEDLQQDSKFIEMPINPTSIYLGKDFDKNNLKKMKEIANKLNCKLYNMRCVNMFSNQFMLEEEEVLF